MTSPYNAEDAQLIGVLGDITWDMVNRKRIEKDSGYKVLWASTSAEAIQIALLHNDDMVSFCY